MGKRLLSFNGATATYLHDEQDGKQAIETVEDVTNTLERAKALHNAGRTRTGMGDRHVASIPITVLDAWARQIGKKYQDVMQDTQLMTRFLRDPANGYFIIDKASV
jgi:D-tyrosyl-tRNA(Tyr) deacylase